MSKAIILDPAHGKDTPGKRSPDGNHREYIWSRERIVGIVNLILQKKDLKFQLYYPFVYQENEPGLTNRVLKYNEISKDHEQTFVLSLHNDAFGDSWSKPHGISVWTSKGDTKADTYATSLFNYLSHIYINEKLRGANWLTEFEETNDPDWEANFTVLAGNPKKNIVPLYDGVLLEWLFQTNKNDVEKLKNRQLNKNFELNIAGWLLSEFNI
jgi:N-acetylmuramoyl-L-alanine amidase